MAPRAARPAATSASTSETSCIAGRSAGAAASIASRTWVSGPSDGGLIEPEATRCSRAMAFSPVPNGGAPSTAAYSVAPSEKTSEAAVDDVPRATSGAM